MSKYLMIRLGLAACLALLGSGCATIECRVKTHPQTYGSLSSSNRRLVLKGQIRIGFRKSAVYLAWGHPNQVRRGIRRGHPFEVWIYTTTQKQVIRLHYPRLRRYGHQHYDSYGPYWHWGRFGLSYDGPPYNRRRNDVIAYEVPYKTAFFENGICTGWEFR